MLKKSLTQNLMSTQIYRYASKTINGVGFSYRCNSTSSQYTLSREATIFTAEALAFKEALLYFNSLIINNILIISDFLSALTALESPNPINEIIRQIHHITFLSPHNIELMWDPSHIGITGNENSDLLANEAITSPSSKTLLCLPYQDISY